MGSSNIVLGITAGDPAGIGPEVSLKALNSISDQSIIPVLIARHDILKKNYPDLLDDYIIVESKDDLLSKIKRNRRFIYNLNLDLPLPKPGSGNINTGLESRLYIDAAIDLWKSGISDAVVTGPVNKGFIEESGTPFTGHTEYIADRINEKNPYMMMYSAEYRVILVTTHVPLEKLADSLDADKIYRTISEGYKAVKSIDGKDVRIAITGLDPHCGDSGAIGNFDQEITMVAVEKARENSIDIEGPFSADTLFIPDRWKSYNLVVAHYHDQGLIPFKMLAFETGVNVTLGLSIVRTSVDHGTAYDIAGKGIAKFGSMVEALKLACLLAGGS